MTSNGLVVLLECVGSIVALSTICIISSVPGIWLQADVEAVHNSVINSMWDEWHTMGYLLFVKFCYLFKESQYSVNIIHTIIWVIINSVTLWVLSKERNGNRMMKVYTIVLLLMFSPFYYLQIMYKDVIFSMFMLGLTVFILYILNNKANVFMIIYGTITALGVSLFRHAGNIPVFCSLFFVGLFMFRKKEYKKVKALSVILVITFISSELFLPFVSSNILQATPNPNYIAYGTPMYMVGAALNRNIEFDEEDIEQLEKVMPLDTWKECYDRYMVDKIARGWSTVGYENLGRIEKLIEDEGYGFYLIKLNGKLLLHHPVFYVRCVLDPSSILWELATPNDGYNMSASGVSEQENVTYTGMWQFTKRYTDFTYSVPILKDILWRGGFSLLLILFSVVLMILKKRYMDLLLFFPIGIFDCLLLLTIPSQDPRYALSTIEVAVLSLAYSTIQECEKNSTYYQEHNITIKR